MSGLDGSSYSQHQIDHDALLKISRETPLLYLTPLRVYSPTELLQLFADFSSNCTERHFLSAAARYLQPYEAAEFAVPDTVRKVVFAHLHKRISDLDLHSYVYIVALGVVARSPQAPSLDEGSVFDERNYFWRTRDSIYNSVSMTLKTLKTELKDVDSAIYRAVELIYCVDQIQYLTVSPGEELQFERIASRACSLCWEVMAAVEAQCERHRLTVTSIYQNDQTMSNLVFEQQQIALILATIAAIPLLKLYNYVQEVASMAEKTRAHKRELKSEMARYKKVLSKITEYSGVYLVQNAVVTKYFVYRPFAELTPYEYNEIKFQSTANLYRYISMKRQLGVEPSMRLFQEKQDTLLDKLTYDDLIAEQNNRKMQELERFRQNAIYNRTVLDQCIATAGAYQLLSKTYQLSQLENVSLTPAAPQNLQSPQSSQRTISLGGSASSEKSRIAYSILMLNFDEYEVQVRNYLFQAFLSDFGTQDKIRIIIEVLLICRAIYAAQFFGSISGYRKAFAPISRGFDADCEYTVRYNAYKLGDDLSIKDLTPGGVPRRGQLLIARADNAVHADMLNSSAACTISMYKATENAPVILCDPTGNPERKLDRSHEMNKIDVVEDDLAQKDANRIAVDITTGLADFRLIADTILTSQLHLLIMYYIRWISERNKLDSREVEIFYLSEAEQVQRRVVQLRVFTNYLGAMFLRGGKSVGYIVYINTFSETIDHILLKPQLLDLFDDEEVGYLLIALYKLPFYDDYFQLLKVALKRALNATALIYTQIKAILKDVWVYAYNNADDYELGRLLYESY